MMRGWCFHSDSNCQIIIMNVIALIAGKSQIIMQTHSLPDVLKMMTMYLQWWRSLHNDYLFEVRWILSCYNWRRRVTEKSLLRFALYVVNLTSNCRSNWRPKVDFFFFPMDMTVSYSMGLNFSFDKILSILVNTFSFMSYYLF